MSAQDKCLDRIQVGFDDTQLVRVGKTRFKDGFSAALALAFAIQEENDSRPILLSPPRSPGRNSQATTLPINDEIISVKSESPARSAASSPDRMTRGGLGDQAVQSPMSDIDSQLERSGQWEDNDEVEDEVEDEEEDKEEDKEEEIDDDGDYTSERDQAEATGEDESRGTPSLSHHVKTRKQTRASLNTDSDQEGSGEGDTTPVNGSVHHLERTIEKMQRLVGYAGAHQYWETGKKEFSYAFVIKQDKIAKVDIAQGFRNTRAVATFLHDNLFDFEGVRDRRVMSCKELGACLKGLIVPQCHDAPLVTTV